MQYLSGFVAVLVAVVGWYIAAVNRTRSEIVALRIAQAGLEARSNAHDGAMQDIKREIADIRENMVRRHDLDQMIDSIGARIDDALKTRKR